MNKKNFTFILVFIFHALCYSQNLLADLEEELLICIQKHPVSTANSRIKCYNQFLVKLKKAKDSLITARSTVLKKEQKERFFNTLKNLEKYNDSILNSTYLENKKYDTGSILRAGFLFKKVELSKIEYLFVSNYKVQRP